jgi:hypothetical protein
MFKILKSTLAALLLLTNLSAWADQVLIIDAQYSTVTQNVKGRLEAAGHTVTVTTNTSLVPTTTGTYQQVWDLRYSAALTAGETTNYTAFVTAGGFAYFVTENPGCCMSRNNSVAALITGLGGGSTQIGPGWANNIESNVNTTYMTTGITVNYAAVAAIVNSQGIPLISDASNVVSGMSWIGRAGALGSGVLGTIVTVADTNWLDSTRFIVGGTSAQQQNVQALDDIIKGIVAGTVGGTISASGNGAAASNGAAQQQQQQQQAPSTFDHTNATENVQTDKMTAGTFTGNGGTLTANSNALTVSNNIALDTNGMTYDANGQNSSLTGVISGSGSITFTGSGTTTLTATNTYTGATTINSGATLVNNGSIASSSGVTNNGTFTNNGAAPGVTNAGTFTNSATGTAASLTNSGTATNAGTITGTVTNTGTFTNSGTTGNWTNSNTLNNSGTMGNGTNTGTFTNGGTVGTVSNNTGGTFTNNGTTGAVTNNAAFTNNLGKNTGAVTNTGTFANAGTTGAVTNSSTGTFTNSGTTTTVTNNGSFTNSGTTGAVANNDTFVNNTGATTGAVANTSTFTNNGTIGNITGNTGTITNAGTAGDWLNNATINNSGIMGNGINNGNFTNNTGATVGNFTNAGIFNNQGTIGNVTDNSGVLQNAGTAQNITNSGTISNTGTAQDITNNAGGIIANTGTVSNVTNAGTFASTGTVGAVVNTGTFANSGTMTSLNNSGTFIAGPTTLTTYTQTATGFTVLDYGTKLTVTGAANLNGNLTLLGAVPALGKYSVLTGNGVTGTYSGYIGAGVLHYTPTEVQVWIMPDGTVVQTQVNNLANSLSGLNNIAAGSMNSALGNDCASFGAKQACMSTSFGSTKVGSGDLNSVGLTLAKAISPNWRIGVFGNKSTSDPETADVKYKSNPAFGGFIGWNKHPDAIGLAVTLSAATTRGTYTIGSDKTNASGNAVQLKLSYSQPISLKTTVTQYVGIRQSEFNVSGFTESNALFPITYGNVQQRTIDLLLGTSVAHRLSDKITGTFSAGVVQNLKATAGTVNAVSDMGNFTSQLPGNSYIAASAGLGLSVQVAKNQRLGINTGWQQRGLTNPNITNYGISYSVGF